MSDTRESFEAVCPVPDGVYWESWSENDGQYEAESQEHEEAADIQQARLQGWKAARAQGDAEPVGVVINKTGSGEYEFYPATALPSLPNGVHKAYVHPPKAQAVPEWISVDDLLPDADLEVLTSIPGVDGYELDYVDVCADTGSEWFANDPHRAVTLWLQIPQPPQEDSGDE